MIYLMMRVAAGTCRVLGFESAAKRLDSEDAWWIVMLSLIALMVLLIIVGAIIGG